MKEEVTLIAERIQRYHADKKRLYYASINLLNLWYKISSTGTKKWIIKIFNLNNTVLISNYYWQ